MSKDLHEKGSTNHLLINQIMLYNKDHFNAYVYLVYRAMIKRGILPQSASLLKLNEYVDFEPNITPKVLNVWDNWHTKEYLRMNMSNLAEKHYYGVGKSRITDEEWQVLLDGYKQITNGEEYVI